MTIAVIDGMGGGIGRAVVEALRRELPDCDIWGLGTNAVASSAMRKAGANAAASGENAIVISAKKADIIVGALGIILADSMMGELTPNMALAIATSPADKLLLPMSRCGVELIGLCDIPLAQQIAELVERIKARVDGGQSFGR